MMPSLTSFILFLLASVTVTTALVIPNPSASGNGVLTPSSLTHAVMGSEDVLRTKLVAKGVTLVGTRVHPLPETVTQDVPPAPPPPPPISPDEQIPIPAPTPSASPSSTQSALTSTSSSPRPTGPSDDHDLFDDLVNMITEELIDELAKELIKELTDEILDHFIEVIHERFSKKFHSHPKKDLIVRQTREEEYETLKNQVMLCFITGKCKGNRRAIKRSMDTTSLGPKPNSTFGGGNFTIIPGLNHTNPKSDLFEEILKCLKSGLCELDHSKNGTAPNVAGGKGEHGFANTTSPRLIPTPKPTSSGDVRARDVDGETHTMTLTIGPVGPLASAQARDEDGKITMTMTIYPVEPPVTSKPPLYPRSSSEDVQARDVDVMATSSLTFVFITMPDGMRPPAVHPRTVSGGDDDGDGGDDDQARHIIATSISTFTFATRPLPSLSHQPSLAGDVQARDVDVMATSSLTFVFITMPDGMRPPAVHPRTVSGGDDDDDEPPRNMVVTSTATITFPTGLVSPVPHQPSLPVDVQPRDPGKTSITITLWPILPPTTAPPSTQTPSPGEIQVRDVDGQTITVSLYHFSDPTVTVTVTQTPTSTSTTVAETPSKATTVVTETTLKTVTQTLFEISPTTSTQEKVTVYQVSPTAAALPK